MKRIILILIALFFLCQGCAFMSLGLMESARPLAKKQTQEEGKYKILIVDISGTITVEIV